MRYSIEPISLRFKQPAGTSRGVYLERKLWYVHLYDGQYHGIGECAPLFDLSCDYRSDMRGLIDEACADLVNGGQIDYEKYRDCPSVLFALETALLSLEGGKRGNALQLFNNPFSQGKVGLPINGLVWMGSYDEMLCRMEEKLAQGFRCIKIKIGAIDFNKEVALLRHLRKQFPKDRIQLRVDANGGFSPSEAMAKLRILASLDIHSIEQPIKQHQWGDMARLCRETPIPIALDEELIGVNRIQDKRTLLNTVRPQYIILKPTLHGGLRGCDEWITLAKERNIGFWITSALESNVGLNAIAQWTAEQKGLTMPQGLGTGLLFDTNFEQTDLEIQDDLLWVSSSRQREFQADLKAFQAEWAKPSPLIEVHTSGSTGTPKPLMVEKERMIASAKATIDFLGLQPGDSALLCMPLRYIAGIMVVVRSIVSGLTLKAVAPSARPFRTMLESPTFAAITPMQAVESLAHKNDRKVMRGVKHLIIGGGAIPTPLADELKSFPNNVWSTYGMTETLSHIAMRRLSGATASLHYIPMPGVEVTTSCDNCLQISAPAICPQILNTNDIAEVFPDGSFVILGRKDNVVCSGGIKLQIEHIEAKLKKVMPCPFMLTSINDNRLGEALVMLYEGNMDSVEDNKTAEALKILCKSVLDKYETPHHFVSVPSLPLTETNKPARHCAKVVAQDILKDAQRD